MLYRIIGWLYILFLAGIIWLNLLHPHHSPSACHTNVYDAQGAEIPCLDIEPYDPRQ